MTWIDVRAVYRELGISLQENTLDDRGLRAVAVAGPHHRPAVLVNSGHETNRWKSGFRFTLAHELCHILFVRDYGTRLAFASGPWAPRDVERRANAFAAMFLMPTDLVSSAIRRSSAPVDSVDGVLAVSNELKTSFTATVEHLYNTGYLDETTRDQVKAEAETRIGKEPQN